MTDEIPADVHGLEKIKPRYTTLKGWRQPTDGITDFDRLPRAAQEYLHFQERESGARIGMVSTGPDREQTMVLPEFAAALAGVSRVNWCMISRSPEGSTRREVRTHDQLHGSHEIFPG